MRIDPELAPRYAYDCPIVAEVLMDARGVNYFDRFVVREGSPSALWMMDPIVSSRHDPGCVKPPRTECCRNAAQIGVFDRFIHDRGNKCKQHAYTRTTDDLFFNNTRMTRRTVDGCTAVDDKIGPALRQGRSCQEQTR